MGEDDSLAGAVIAYLDAGFEQPELLRMFIWEGLTGTAPGDEALVAEGEADEVADLRERKAAGEIASDIDPAYLLVVLMGAVTTPVTMPPTIERLCGVPPDSPEFRTRFADQLRVILGHLQAPASERPAARRTAPARASRRRRA